MPISPISPFDLINIAKVGGLNNAVDVGAGFSANVSGSESDSGGSPGHTTESVNCGSGGAYFLEADIDWTGLILTIPDGAIIREITFRGRASVTGDANSTFTRLTGVPIADGDASSGINASLSAPDTSIVPKSDNQASASDVKDVDASIAFSITANVLSGSMILSISWINPNDPSEYITKVQLIAEFTKIIVTLISNSFARVETSGHVADTFTWSLDSNIQFTFDAFSGQVSWEYIYQWTLNPPDLSGVQEGDLITITSTEPNPLLLNELTLEMGGIPVVPTTQTPNEVTFNVPALPAGPAPIIATGNGTQFSGSLPLSVLEIIGADVSGIYVLDNGKTNDTLYSSTRDGSVTERAIPNPSIDTGYVGG